MRIKILNSDSFGVRSMATVIEAEGMKVFIDPGAALGPRRYGLPPAQEEIEALEKAKEEILKEVEDADIIIITHYHYDHYFPEESFYKGKTLIVKHGDEMINWSQKKRFYRFRKNLEALGLTPIQTNGGEYRFEGVYLRISPPFPHGPEGTKLGYVLMVRAEDENGNSFLFTSDVQGPISDRALDWALKNRAEIVFVDGPATYLGGYRIPQEEIERGISNLRKLASEVGTLIVDHHMLRDLEYRKHLEGLDNVFSAAEFMGKPERMLEAHRKDLWRLKRES